MFKEAYEFLTKYRKDTDPISLICLPEGSIAIEGATTYTPNDTESTALMEAYTKIQDNLVWPTVKLKISLINSTILIHIVITPTYVINKSIPFHQLDLANFDLLTKEELDILTLVNKSILNLTNTTIH